MKETYTRKIIEEYNDDTMDTSYNQDEYKHEGMNLDSEPSNQDPLNNGQVINIDDEM